MRETREDRVCVGKGTWEKKMKKDEFVKHGFPDNMGGG